MFTKITSAVLVAAVLATSTAAMATPNLGTEVDVGFITEVNETDRTVTLNDGAEFDVPYGLALGLYNVGQKVSVSFATYGETKKASTIVFSN
jgi:Protein of unknown function (DUF1344)